MRVLAMSKFFHIYEDDLAELERLAPLLCERLQLSQDGKVPGELKIKVRRVKEILSNIRWDYQPYDEVGRIPADDDAEP